MARRIPSVIALQELAVHLLLSSMNIAIPSTAAAAAAGGSSVVRILASRAAAYWEKDVNGPNNAFVGVRGFRSGVIPKRLGARRKRKLRTSTAEEI